MSLTGLIAAYRTTPGDIENRRLLPPFEGLNSNELEVIRWLLWRLNDDSGQCIPSDADITIGTHLSEKTVQRARKGLREKGLIDWTERRYRGRRTSNSYSFPGLDLSVSMTGSKSAPDDLSVNLGSQEVNATPPSRQNHPDLPVTVTEEIEGKNKTDEKEGEKKAPPNPPGGFSLQQQNSNDNGHVPPASLPAPSSGSVVQAAQIEQQRVEENLRVLEAQREQKPGHGPTERAIDTERQRLSELATIAVEAPA